MATQTQVKSDSEDVQQKVQEFRQLFADATLSALRWIGNSRKQARIEQKER